MQDSRQVTDQAWEEVMHRQPDSYVWTTGTHWVPTGTDQDT